MREGAASCCYGKPAGSIRCIMALGLACRSFRALPEVPRGKIWAGIITRSITSDPHRQGITVSLGDQGLAQDFILPHCQNHPHQGGQGVGGDMGADVAGDAEQGVHHIDQRDEENSLPQQ